MVFINNGIIVLKTEILHFSAIWLLLAYIMLFKSEEQRHTGLPNSYVNY